MKQRVIPGQGLCHQEVAASARSFGISVGGKEGLKDVLLDSEIASNFLPPSFQPAPMSRQEPDLDLLLSGAAEQTSPLAAGLLLQGLEFGRPVLAVGVWQKKQEIQVTVALEKLTSKQSLCMLVTF